MNKNRHEEVAYMLAELLGHSSTPPELRDLLMQYFSDLIQKVKLDSPTTILALYPVLQQLLDERGVQAAPDQAVQEQGVKEIAMSASAGS